MCLISSLYSKNAGLVFGKSTTSNCVAKLPVTEISVVQPLSRRLTPEYKAATMRQRSAIAIEVHLTLCSVSLLPHLLSFEKLAQTFPSFLIIALGFLLKCKHISSITAGLKWPNSLPGLFSTYPNMPTRYQRRRSRPSKQFKLSTVNMEALHSQVDFHFLKVSGAPFDFIFVPPSQPLTMKSLPEASYTSGDTMIKGRSNPMLTIREIKALGPLDLAKHMPRTHFTHVENKPHLIRNYLGETYFLNKPVQFEALSAPLYTNENSSEEQIDLPTAHSSTSDVSNVDVSASDSDQSSLSFLFDTDVSLEFPNNADSSATSVCDVSEDEEEGHDNHNHRSSYAFESVKGTLEKPQRARDFSPLVPTQTLFFSTEEGNCSSECCINLQSCHKPSETFIFIQQDAQLKVDRNVPTADVYKKSDHDGLQSTEPAPQTVNNSRLTVRTRQLIQQRLFKTAFLKGETKDGTLKLNGKDRAVFLPTEKAKQESVHGITQFVFEECSDTSEEEIMDTNSKHVRLLDWDANSTDDHPMSQPRTRFEIIEKELFWSKRVLHTSLLGFDDTVMSAAQHTSLREKKGAAVSYPKPIGCERKIKHTTKQSEHLDGENHTTFVPKPIGYERRVAKPNQRNRSSTLNQASRTLSTPLFETFQDAFVPKPIGYERKMGRIFVPIPIGCERKMAKIGDSESKLKTKCL